MPGQLTISMLDLLLTVHIADADRGSLTMTPSVRLYELAQHAVVAFNGTEEILIMSTDLRASEPTEVVEVIPLPSEPVVSEGDGLC